MSTHDGTRRLSLPPLSHEAVGRLAADRVDDVEQLYRLTGGVPFYVREVLNAAPGQVPRTVADVVAARTSRLSPPARRLLAAAAVLGRPVTARVVAAVAGVDDADALDECLDSGTLVGGPTTYRFRHEITRLAVERATPAHRRSRLHAAALALLRTADPLDHARRLAHHAEAAGLLSEHGPCRPALSAAREGLRQAEAAGCTAAVAYSLNTLGMQRIGAGEDGFDDLARSLALAREHGLDEAVGRGHANLYQAAVDRFRFAEYASCFTDGMQYGRDNDMATYTVCLRGSHALALLRTGRLTQTVALAEKTLRETVSPVNRLHLVIPLAAARLRQGDACADDLLEQAWQLETGTGEHGWLVRVAAVQAEAAWLAGGREVLDARVTQLDGCAGEEDPWLRAELTAWLDRLGVPTHRPAPPAVPYALELAGDYEPPRSGGTRRVARTRRRSSARAPAGRGTSPPHWSW